MANDALLLSDIDAYYGDSHVLHRVSLRLGQGRLLGLLGRNGAGKSTCMSVAMGWLPPRRGEVSVYGTRSPAAHPRRSPRAGVALVPQGRRVFRGLTVRENLIVAFSKIARRRRDAMDAGANCDMFPRLAERRDHYAGHLSGGEQQMLAIGRALMSNPRVLLMDDRPRASRRGSSPRSWRHPPTQTAGLSIVLVEPNAKLVLDVADDIVVLNSGRVVVDPRLRHCGATPWICISIWGCLRACQPEAADPTAIAPRIHNQPNDCPVAAVARHRSRA